MKRSTAKPTKFDRLKDQRRRNAATIKRRNATIRDMQWQIDVLKDCVEDYKFLADFYKALIKEHMGMPK